jgi:hypothetical protein
VPFSSIAHTVTFVSRARQHTFSFLFSLQFSGRVLRRHLSLRAVMHVAHAPHPVPGVTAPISFFSRATRRRLTQCARGAQSVCNGAAFLMHDGALFPRVRGALDSFSAQRRLILVRDGALLYRARRRPLSTCTRRSGLIQCTTAPHSARDGASFSCATAPSSIVCDGAFPHRAQ